MARKQFDVRVEDDGTASINTGDLKGEHHHAADDFLKYLIEELGGDYTVKSTKLHRHADGTTNSHSHEEA